MQDGELISAGSERFVKAVEKVYAAAPDPSRWPAALQAIADCFDDLGALLVYARDDGSFGIIESPLITPMLAEYARDWSRRDTRAFRGRERGYFIAGEVVTDRDVVTPAEMETDPFYVEYLAKHGLKYFAAVTVSPDPSIEVAISVQRRADKPEFSAEETSLLGRIAPHIESSLRLSVRLMNTELTNAGLSSALSRIDLGVFVLNSLGRIVFSNASAERAIGDGLEVVNNRLLFSPSARRGEAETAVARVIDGDSDALVSNPKPILIERRRSNRPLVLYVLPVALDKMATNAFLTHARAIILIIDPEVGAPPDPSLVRDLLGLTLAEARVASLIGSGLAPREAALKLGVTEETARTALKRVFEKVGVSRQSELAALMTRLVLK